MNKRKFFLGAGATVLAFASVMAGRASVRNTQPSTLYVSTAGGACKALTITSSATFTTGQAGLTQATIKTQNGNFTRRVWATNNCATGAKPVHFKG
jgi:hypothetical protein